MVFAYDLYLGDPEANSYELMSFCTPSVPGLLKGHDTPSKLILLEIFKDRHSIKSTIITSQLPITA